MLYYNYFWSHVGLKLLFSCVSYFTYAKMVHVYPQQQHQQQQVTLPKNREKFLPDNSLYPINLEICFKKQL